MDDIEALKRQKLQQLQQQQEQQQEQRQKIQQVMQQIDAIIRRLLTAEARQRLENLTLIKPELVQKLKVYLAQLYVSGQAKQIDDQQLKQILQKLQGQKKEMKITRI